MKPEQFIVNCISHYNSLHWREKVRPVLSKVKDKRARGLASLSLGVTNFLLGVSIILIFVDDYTYP